MRRWIKYILYAILGFIGLITVSLLTTQTRFFKNWLCDYVVEAANEILAGELEIARIDGNLFSYLEVFDILIKNELDTVLYIPKLSIDFSPVGILRKNIIIDALVIESPYVKLAQLPDSTWNVNNLTKPTSSKSIPDSSAVSEPFGYQVTLIDFQLKDARIDIASIDTLLPRQVKDFNINLSLQFSEKEQELHLKEFRLKTEQPAFNLQELSLKVKRNEHEILLQSFVLRTGRNRLDSDGIYYSSVDLNSTGQLQSQSIDFSEFQVFVPCLRIAANPTFSFKTNYKNDNLKYSIELGENDQLIFMQGEVENIGKILKGNYGEASYSLSGRIQNFDIAYWLDNPKMEYLINGEFNLKGKGFNPETAEFSFDASFSGCNFFGRFVDEITLESYYKQGDIKNHLKVDGDFGQVIVNADVIDLIKTQQFNIQLILRELNFAILLQDDSLQTDLNLDVIARGSGFERDNVKGNLQINLAPSSILNVKLDTLYSTIKIDADNYLVEYFHMGSDFMQLEIEGLINPVSKSDISFKVQLEHLMALNHFIQADTIFASGLIEGKIHGKLDSLSANVKFGFDNIVYNSNTIDSLSGEILVTQAGDVIEWTSSIRIKNIGMPNFSIDTIDLQSDFTQNAGDIFVDVSDPELNAKLHAIFKADSIQRVFIPNLTIDYKNQHWSGGSSNMEIVLQNNSIDIQNFHLNSMAGKYGVQTISANGKLSFTGEENFQLQVTNIDIEPLAEIFQVPLKIGGRFFFEMDIYGSADKPVFTVNSGIQYGQINQLSYQEIGVRMNYANEQFSLHFSFMPNQEDSLTIKVFLPMNLSLANQNNILLEDQSLQVRIFSDGIPLDVIRAGDVFFGKIQGRILCDLTIENTLKDLQLGGFFRLENGAFKMPDFGVDYSDLQLNLSLDRKRITLDTLFVKHENGKIQATGFFEFDSSLVSGVVNSTHFDFLADEFYLMRHQNYEVQISGGAQLNGSFQTPQFGGNITVLRSSFFLPAFMEENTNASVANENTIPMLVAAMHDSLGKGDSVKVGAKSGEAKYNNNDFYHNLRGSLKISIPKNSWLKSPEMRMEIAGEIDLVKNGPEFEIFGPIRIVRGHYDLRGRRFNIVEGRLNFQGGAEYNPEFILELNYIFRTATREKKSLTLFVTGKALTPNLKFTLDDDEITEGDAVSYIMFGKSLDELTSGQRSSIAGESGRKTGANLVQGFAANLVAKQLTKLLGNNLNVDFFEITSQDNWQNATFVVGKYLTNDLFMSYQRSFGENENESIEPVIITLEYELTKFLFLQLINGDDKTTGYDVILKFER